MTYRPVPPNDPRWDQLAHLVAGELSADEAAALRAWIAADPERQRTLAQLEAIWRATEPSAEARPDAWDAEAELRRIRSEMGGTGRVIARVGSDVGLERLHGRRSRIGVALRVAAAVVLVVGGGILWRTRMPEPVAMSGSEPATTEYRTAPGQRLSFGLPDGTRVMLAPGSVLRRPATYGMHDRTVYLDGEAYFYVTHDENRPFAVHTARAVARDLGTRFVVRAYADGTPTDIVVSEGLVAVTRASSRLAGDRPREDSLLVRPGQRASITGDGPLVFSSAVALEPYFGWTAGQLVFQRTPLPDVARQLERWYGIDIEIGDAKLHRYRLTATLREEGAAEALDLVATSLKLTVTRVGHTYVFADAGR